MSKTIFKFNEDEGRDILLCANREKLIDALKTVNTLYRSL